MAKQAALNLSRREQQIMDSIYQRGQASVSEVLSDLPDPPSYSSVRALLRILEEKGHLKHKKVGPRYVYMATRSRSHAGRTAIRRLLTTFFDDSVEKTVAALLDVSEAQLSDEQLDGLNQLINQARQEKQ